MKVRCRRAKAQIIWENGLTCNDICKCATPHEKSDACDAICPGELVSVARSSLDRSPACIEVEEDDYS